MFNEQSRRMAFLPIWMPTWKRFFESCTVRFFDLREIKKRECHTKWRTSFDGACCLSVAIRVEIQKLPVFLYFLPNPLHFSHLYTCDAIWSYRFAYFYILFVVIKFTTKRLSPEIPFAQNPIQRKYYFSFFFPFRRMGFI